MCVQLIGKMDVTRMSVSQLPNMYACSLDAFWLRPIQKMAIHTTQNPIASICAYKISRLLYLFCCCTVVCHHFWSYFDADMVFCYLISNHDTFCVHRGTDDKNGIKYYRKFNVNMIQWHKMWKRNSQERMNDERMDGVMYGEKRRRAKKSILCCVEYHGCDVKLWLKISRSRSIKSEPGSSSLVTIFFFSVRSNSR